MKLEKVKKSQLINVILVLFIASLFTTPAVAEIKTVNLHVDGIFCPFCALSLEKKLKKVEAVSTVDVHLKKGVTDVMLKPNVTFDLKALQQAVKKAGFTLKNVDVEVIGTVIRNEDGFLVLESEGDQTRFILSDQDQAETLAQVLSTKIEEQLTSAQSQGHLVLIMGVVHEHDKLPPGLMIKKLEIIAQ